MGISKIIAKGLVQVVEKALPAERKAITAGKTIFSKAAARTTKSTGAAIKESVFETAKRTDSAASVTSPLKHTAVEPKPAAVIKEPPSPAGKGGTEEITQRNTAGGNSSNTEKIISTEDFYIDDLNDVSNFGIKNNAKLRSQIKHKKYYEIAQDDKIIKVSKNDNGYIINIKTLQKETDISGNGEALFDYIFTRWYRDINRGTEQLAKGHSIDVNIQKKIDNLTRLIDSEPTAINKNKIYYRFEENLWFLENTKTKYGKDLIKDMNKVVKRYNSPDVTTKEKQELDRLIDDIEQSLDCSVPEYESSHFLSTTEFNSKPAKLSKDMAIKFKFTNISDRVKGIDVVDYFMDDINNLLKKGEYILETLSTDRETLFQRGCKIKINKITFDKEKNIWVAEANLDNNKIF